MLPKPPPLCVLYEDNHLLVVNKPVMLPTMGVAEDRPSLLRQAKQYIRAKFQKPGNVYLGVVSRLDAPVSGVVLLARTSKAAARLTEQFRERLVDKVYWAVVHGVVEPASGELTDFIRKDERHRRMHISHAQHPGAKQARLTYRVRQEFGQEKLLEIRLLTGRKHQIRVQLAHQGWPILGDRKYGSPQKFPAGIALHSRRLTFEHPTRKTKIEITAPLPSSWRSFGIAE